MDALKNFSYSLVATAPSPATSGTSLVVTAGQGSYFPATPFDATIWPSGVQPTNTNAEIVRVTNVSTDTFTITRAQYGTTAQSIAVGYQIAQTVDANLLNQLAPLSGATFTGNVTAPAHIASGLTGATAASRYVGATTNGAPTSGTFAVGDFIVDQTSTFWVCTTAGTPGTWWPLVEAHMVSRSATATAGPNEVTIFTGSTASQTISAIGSPVDGATWTIINRSSVAVTAGFGASSMLPLGSTSSVTSLVVPVNGAYSFINYAAGQWYMTASNNLANSVGTLSVTNGGTGTATAPAVGSIPVATSTSAYTPLAIGTNGQVLTSNGTTASWQAVASVPLATVDLTAQSAAISATTLYTPPTAGIYTITYYAKVTTAATTSSVLGAFSVISTDTDSNVVNTVGNTSTQNSLTTGFISGTITVYAKASTAIQYTMGYTSSGATAMQYELHMAVSGSTISTSTGTVTSFNGRSGTVTPGNADYLAVPTGGLTGATAATRYVGGTASGAPTSGTFAVGDHIVDQTGSIYICTTAGTPGTWTQVGAPTTSVTMGGDVTGSSASATVAKLQGTSVSATAPTSNQVLQYNGSAWTPATFGSSAMTLISSQTLASATATVTFSSIPQTYSQIMLIVTASSTYTGSNVDNFQLQVNSVSSGQHYNQLTIFYANALATNQAVGYIGSGGTYFSSGTGTLVTHSQLTSQPTTMEILFPNYSKTTIAKNYIGSIFSYTTFYQNFQMAGTVNTTSAISTLTFTCNANYQAGSAFYLYGIN